MPKSLTKTLATNIPIANILVKLDSEIKHRRHISHLTNIPTTNVLIKGGYMFKDTSMTLNNMDSTLRGWAKLDTTAGESAIQNNVGWSIANYTDAPC
jgi:hydroxymethylpyrimidine/phosphomethylpyrimidine kinase